MKGDRGSSDAKVEAWTQLAHTTFALAATTAWALPLLDLLLRVQINVLGRRLYFASLEQCVQSATPACLLHSAVTSSLSAMAIEGGDFQNYVCTFKGTSRDKLLQATTVVGKNSTPTECQLPVPTVPFVTAEVARA